MSTCTKQRQYDININKIRTLDTMEQVYKIIIAGLIVSITMSYFYISQPEKDSLYIMVGVIFSACLFYIIIYQLPKLNKDNYDHQITLYRRELGGDADFYDLSIDEIIASASSE